MPTGTCRRGTAAKTFAVPSLATSRRCESHRDGLPRRLGDDAEQPRERLQRLADGGPRRKPRRAIACYESALRVRTETDFPADWAMTQNNLGVAFRNLPTGDRGENLRRAIACYESALRVRTETDFPSDWAMTQNNLGNAYSNLPKGDREANVRRAIACYESALRVHTETDFPSDWARTNFNLGLTLREIGQFDQSVAAFESAIRGYESVGDAANAENARNAAEESRRMKDSTRLPT